MDYKNYEDGQHIITIIIPGRPATKKTSQRIVKVGRYNKILPSKKYMEYEAHCKQYLDPIAKELKEPLDFGIGIEIYVTLPDWKSVGDSVGYYQSIFDILEHYGIVANDQWLMPTNVNHFLTQPNKQNPQLKIILTRYRHPLEAYRENKK